MTLEPNPQAGPLKEVTIFTDGGAVPNPGRGGYGVVLRFGPHSRELSAGYNLTTNNRMEMMAVIAGLETLKERCKVKLYSDSKYIVDAIQNGSAFRWRDNNWSLTPHGSKQAKNPDLWQRLLAAYDKHDVEMIWVKGHAGIDDNERCDQLATAAAQQHDLLPDDGYQPTRPTPAKPAQADQQMSRSRTQTTKTKITNEGHACRKCGTPVVKRVPKNKPLKANQTYYYSWYLYCPSCKTMYMVEAARREITAEGRLFGDESHQ